MVRHSIVAAVGAIQQANGWNDTRTAKQLGLSLSGWIRIRNSDRQPGLEFGRGVYTGFPQLRPAALAFLTGDATMIVAHDDEANGELTKSGGDELGSGKRSHP